MPTTSQEIEKHLAVRNPRTGEKDYFFALPDKTLIAGRAQQLRQAQVPWSHLSIAER